MLRRFCRVVVWSLVAGVVLPAAGDAQPLVIRGATLIDGHGGTPVADALVLLDGDRIVSVGDSETPWPAGARVIEADGKYLIPGLMDMHVHLRGAVDAGPMNRATPSMKLVTLFRSKSLVALWQDLKVDLMLRRFCRVVVWSLVAGVVLPAAGDAQPLVIRGATLIDGHGGTPVE